MKYKVCILDAGKSKRENLKTEINPALLPVGNKSIISRIIEQFPVDTEFVIISGKSKHITRYMGCSSIAVETMTLKLQI